MTSNRAPRRRSFLLSFRDALRGIWDCLLAERNMRIHFVAGAYVLFFALRMGLSRGEMACVTLAIGLVTAAEAVNTAIEKLCDFNQKHLNPHIRVVKDMAAGAVLLCAVAAALAGVFIFLRPELLKCLAELWAQPGAAALLALITVLAVVFIVLGPEGIRERIFRRRRGK